MLFFLTVYAAWIIAALGVINFITAALILASCRTVPGLSGLLKHERYKRFYKIHGYLWWIFWPSVIIHVIMAMLRFITNYYG